MKKKTIYACQECGTVSAKWQGRCLGCNKWNTITEDIILPSEKSIEKSTLSDILESDDVPCLLSTVEICDKKRIECADKELSRVLGGGIVYGSIILVGGDPGIGKSTLMLQMAMSLLDSKILYISGEESARQVKLRAVRIQKNKSIDDLHTTNTLNKQSNLDLKKEVQPNDSLYILTETNLDKIFNHSKKIKPDIIIIDSIQTLYSSSLDSIAGSISQIKNSASLLMYYAKKTNVSIFLIGHITKEGTLAGPKVLEHIVDTVLQFEGEPRLSYRILRTTKNRFGSTSELGIYEMRSNGLRQVENPSELLLSEHSNSVSGIAIGVFIEGNRPLVVEVQALVGNAAYGNPQRSTTGFDYKRLNMLLAVLEKRLNCRVLSKDVFLNITGGIKIDDPSLDLAVCISILSSYLEIDIPHTVCFCGEVGLSGEIRPVARIEARISEAEKLGFQCLYVPKHNIKSLTLEKYNISLKSYEYLENIFSDLKCKTTTE